MKNSLARLGLDTNAVWVDARQMMLMTTRASDTLTQTDTNRLTRHTASWLPHTLSHTSDGAHLNTLGAVPLTLPPVPVWALAGTLR